MLLSSLYTMKRRLPTKFPSDETAGSATTAPRTHAAGPNSGALPLIQSTRPYCSIASARNCSQLPITTSCPPLSS